MASGRIATRVLTALSVCLCAVGRGGEPIGIAPFGEGRVEHFVLERSDADGRVRVVGWVEWRRTELARGRQLQCEVRFADGERVLHVERLTSNDARLVWREIGERSGRSLFAEWSRDGHGLRMLEWGRDGARRGHIGADGTVVMPLYLIELARAGAATQGRFATFDPLGRRLEPLVLRTSYELGHARPAAARRDAREDDVQGPAAEAPFAPLRTVELVHADGTSAGRYAFEGTELIGFSWQAGGARARRIPAEDWRAAVESLERGSAP
jgi:hypothetical protein